MSVSAESNRQLVEHKLKLVRIIALIVAIAATLGITLRVIVAPLAVSVLVLDVACVIAFLAAYVVARRAALQAAGNLLLVAMSVFIVVTGMLVGGLNAPVLSMLPLIPLTAAFLLGVRSGWFYTALLVLALAGMVGLDFSGFELPEAKLDPQQSRLTRAIFLSLLLITMCAIAAAVVKYNDKLKRQLEHVAMHDRLTGIANRGYFDQQLNRECGRVSRSKESAALLILDIDYFKFYNDHFGHQAGDRCLIKVANALTKTCRRATDFVARYGGEEFAIILPDTNAEQASEFAARLREDVACLLIPNPASPFQNITVSIGIAEVNSEKSYSPIQLLRHADVALYNAKRRGRNMFVVYRG